MMNLFVIFEETEVSEAKDAGSSVFPVWNLCIFARPHCEIEGACVDFR